MKRKALIISLLGLVFITGPAACRAAGTHEGEMNNLLGQAYKAAAENKPITSKKLFSEAEVYARSEKNWRGLIDVGNAYSIMVSPKEAIPLLRNAAKISARRNDWRGLVSAGYSMLGLGKTRNARKYALDYLLKARDIALRGKSWRGLTESAIGLLESGEKTLALETAENAAAIARDQRNPEACRRIAWAFQRLGQKARSRGFLRLEKEFRQERIREDKSSGNTKKTGGSAIYKSPGEAFAIKKTEEKEKKYYRSYWTYYGHPFKSNNLSEWGQYHLRYYNYFDGKYVYRGA